jgi:hypothetical protein
MHTSKYIILTSSSSGFTAEVFTVSVLTPTVPGASVSLAAASCNQWVHTVVECKDFAVNTCYKQFTLAVLRCNSKQWSLTYATVYHKLQYSTVHYAHEYYPCSTIAAD